MYWLQAPQQPIAAPVSQAQDATRVQAATGFAHPRVLSGVLLGSVGGAIVLVGQVPFLAVIMLIAYQATQEVRGRTQ